MAGRYSGCYVRTTVSGDSSDHTLASEAYLHTCKAGARGLFIVPFSRRDGTSRGSTLLYLGLLRDFQGIVDFDAQVPDGAFELGMAQEQLNSPQILGSLVDQRRLRPAHGVSAVGAGVESSGGNPLVDDPGVLPC